MKVKSLIIIIFLVCISTESFSKHLFILSGQSNMEYLDISLSFVPTIHKKFGKENVVVVKEALGGQPIRRWYKGWNSLDKNLPKGDGKLYANVMAKIKKIDTPLEDFESVTFIWMQGERDARESFGKYYEKSLLGLYQQLSDDIGRKDMNFVIGRLSDFDMKEEIYPNWLMVRDIQVKIAESNPRFAWVDTDDCNDGVNSKGDKIHNDLHMSVEGYKTMGARFASEAIALIKKHKKRKKRSK